MQTVLVIIFSFISLSLGLSVLSRHIRDASRILFSIYCFAVGFWLIVNHLSVLNLREGAGLFLVRLVMGLAVIQTVSFFLFAHTFPDSYIKLKKKWFFSIIIITILTFIVALSPLLFSHLESKDGQISPVPGLGMVLFIFVAIGSLLSGFILLIIKTKRAKGLLKAQLRYILFGFFLTYILILIFSFILAVFLKNSSFVQFGSYFATPFLAFTAYAIVKHRLFDIRFVLRKGFVHAISLIILLALYTYLILSFQNYFELNRPLTTLIAVLVICLTIYPLRKFLSRNIDALFFAPEKREVSLQKFSSLASGLGLEELLEKAKMALTQGLDVLEIKIFILDESQGEFRAEYPNEIKGRDSIDEGNELVEYLKKKKEIVIKGEIPYLIQGLEEKEAEEFKEIERELKRENAEAVVPLMEENILGLIFLGNKKSQAAFTVQDIRFLNSFSRQFTIYLGNVLLYQQALKRVEKMAGAGER